MGIYDCSAAKSQPSRLSRERWEKNPAREIPQERQILLIFYRFSRLSCKSWEGKVHPPSLIRIRRSRLHPRRSVKVRPLFAVLQMSEQTQEAGLPL